MGYRIRDLQGATLPLTGQEIIEIEQGGSSRQVKVLYLLPGFEETLSQDLADKVDVDKGAAMIGYNGRTQAQRNGDVLSVRDYITTAIDGTTSNQAGIVAAVNDAIAKGSTLYWPPGTYVANSAVPGFYSIKHSGPGSLKNGGTLPITSATTSSISLYVATTGNNNNLGLSAAQPLATISAAVAAIPQDACGTWIINVAAGTYAEALNIARPKNPNLNILVLGPAVGTGAQTVILEGSAQSTSIPGIYVEDLSKVSIKHIKAQNFAYSGVYFMGCGLAQMDNVNVFNCGTSGRELVRTSHGVLVATGCQLDGNNASLNGFVCYHGFMSVLGASTITKCTGAAGLYAESSGGHFDTNVVSNCGRGLYALQGGFPTISSGSITGCTTAAIESDQGSYIAVVSNPAFSGNGVNIRQTISTGIGGKLRDDATRTTLFANNDAFEVITQGGGAFMMQLGNSGLTIPGGAWNSRHLILGAYHLWIDASGRLRIKSGAPTSDTDGTIVGTQA